jgi:hypothetical protein
MCSVSPVAEGANEETKMRQAVWLAVAVTVSACGGDARNRGLECATTCLRSGLVCDSATLSCVPPPHFICDPCATNADCGTGGTCVTEPDLGQSFCATPCNASGGCDAGGNTCFALDEARTITGCYPTAATCVPKSCTDECTEGATRCDGAGILTCAKWGERCFNWGKAAACGSGQVCAGDRCVSSCTDACTPGEIKCTDESISFTRTSYQTCFKASSGCYEFGPSVACETGRVCRSGSGCQACTSSTQCLADETCRVRSASLDKTCGHAFGESYAISVDSVVVPATNLAGAAWDSLTSANADLVVDLIVDNVTVATSAESSNAIGATSISGASGIVEVNLVSSVCFNAYDDDGGGGREWIGGACLSSLGLLEGLRAGVLTGQYVNNATGTPYPVGDFSMSFR